MGTDWKKLTRESKGISADSREDLKGKIFVAYKGVARDGHNFINQAIGKGAIAVVGERNIKSLQVPYLKVKNGRLMWAKLIAGWYGNPEERLKLIGVTGTDGKTTTCHLIYAVLKEAGLKVGLISTVAAYLGNDTFDTGFHVTSPDPDDLWRFLKMAENTEIEYLVLEVTSHALDQERYGDLAFEVGVVTNITHEHLDYHQTFEKYRETKAKLIRHTKYSVLNKDDASFKWLKSKCGQDAKTIAFGKTGMKINNPALEGKYNRYNVGAAEAVAKIFGVDEGLVIKTVQNFEGVPGRREEIALGQSFRTIVDFAHTPNALELFLREIRKELPKKRKLILVFGCAGLRDTTKRPMMGKLAAQLTNKVIVTAEDPRTESLDTLYRQITSQIPIAKISQKVLREDDRQKAINLAVKMAKPGDIVAVTGKGHERSMCFGTEERPWSDKEAVKRAIRKYVCGR